jgi:putative nucleotidyltransferase with HDIG domain
MSRHRTALLYSYGIFLAGMFLWVATVVAASPWNAGAGLRTTVLDAAILLILTFMSSISPVHTRVGSIVTVSMAPLFGAVLLLPPWAAITVAVIGTLDLRVPGRDIPWDRFLFNRGMWAVVCGVPAVALHAVGLTSRQLEWYAALPVLVLVIASLNVGMMATAVWLVSKEPIGGTAKKLVASSLLTYIALPLVGYMIWALMDGKEFPYQLVVFLLYGPLLVYRASIHKQNRLDRWLRESFIMQSRIVDKRDGQTFGHSQRVGELSEQVAHLLHLSEDACNTIRTAGILHDLGKIAIPDSILLKPGKLTPEDYEIIKTHPEAGAEILNEHPEQQGVAEIVMHHHERWDGKGYPELLHGTDIPIGSRIVNACDAFDTITQARVFRPTVKTPAEAIRELRELAGTWYDPAVITALESIVAQKWGVEIAPQLAVVEAPIRYRDVLAVQPFRRLWIGQAVSYFGDMMNTTGLAIMLFLVTHSPSVVALGLISKAVPSILFGLVAGPVVDRFNRQRLMIAADIGRALVTVTIPFLAFHWLPAVFVAVFLVASASAFFNPAKQAILPNLVPGKFLVTANGLVSSSEKTSELLGFAGAGIIAAAVSWAPLFIIDAGTYLFSAASLLGVPDLARRPARRAVTVLQDIREGMRFIIANRVLSATMALTTGGTLFYGMILPLLVVMAYGPLHGGAVGYGLIEAAVGAGAIIGAMSAPRAMQRFRAGVLIIVGTLGIGLTSILTGLSTALWLAIAFLFIQGVLNMLYYVPVISLTQHLAPDYVRGRVMSTRYLLVQGGLLIGMAISGPLADRLGAPVVFAASGFLIICVAALGALSRSLRTATLQDEVPAPPLTAALG